MIRFQLMLALLFLVFETQAQTYQVFKGDTINRRDKSGLKQGVWKRYYENDTLLSVSTFKNGRRTGSFKTFYKSGKLQTDLRFRPSLKPVEISDAILYYETGTVEAKGKYIDQK